VIRNGPTLAGLECEHWVGAGVEIPDVKRRKEPSSPVFGRNCSHIGPTFTDAASAIRRLTPLDAERHEDKSPADAIFEGCLTRFRPIMMTTMAALLGTAPIALGLGAGGEARRPLGLAVVGGLPVSQLITLYLTPVVYTSMAALSSGTDARP
jgi:AcrB/AcrD/AcrF family protein